MFKKYRVRHIAAIFILSAGIMSGLFSPCSVFADISLSEREFWFTARPGEKITEVITVTNNGPKTLTLSGYSEDVKFIEPYDGSRDFLPPGSVERSCAQWAKLGMTDFVLGASEKMEIPFTFQVPEDARGGYYTILIFEQDAVMLEGQRSVGVVLRSGCTIFVETPDTVLQGEYKDISVSDGYLNGELVNTGETVIVAAGSYYTMGVSGLVVDRGELQKIYLPSGKSAAFRFELDPDMEYGEYTILVEYQAQRGNTIVKEIDVTKDESGISITGFRD